MPSLRAVERAWVVVGLVALAGCTDLDEGSAHDGLTADGGDASVGGSGGGGSAPRAATGGAGGTSGRGGSGGSGGTGRTGGTGGTGTMDAGASDGGADSGADAAGDDAAAETDAGSMCEGCHEQATCQLVEGAARCVCPETLVDVAGDGSECTPPCDLAECSEFAQCTAEGLITTCQCVSPYISDGTDCALDVTCSTLGCHASAECVVEGQSRMCRCLNGYQGDGMSCTNIDDCASGPCRNNGVCRDGVNGYTCDCSGTGFAGTTCTQNVNDCFTGACANGGTCRDAVNGFTCDCAGTGYAGPTCTLNVNDCTATSCMHGGRCTDLVNAFSCDCSGTGYTGNRCQTRLCGNGVVNSGEECDPGDTPYVCSTDCEDKNWFEFCNSSAECTGGTVCSSAQGYGLCLHRCTTAADCLPARPGDGAQCLDGYCYLACDSDADCPDRTDGVWTNFVCGGGDYCTYPL